MIDSYVNCWSGHLNSAADVAEVPANTSSLRQLTVCIGLLIALFVPATITASEADPTSPATLELLLPANAKVRIDDRDLGATAETVRFFQYPNVKSGQFQLLRVSVELDPKHTVRQLVAIEAHQHVRLVIPAEGMARPEVVVQTGHTGEVVTVAFSPDDLQLLTGGTDETAILWDKQTGRQLRTFRGKSMTKVAFHPEGQQVALLYGPLDLRNPITGEHTINLVDGYRDATYSPDGNRIGLCSWTNFFCYAGRSNSFGQSLELKKTDDRNGHYANCVAWSPTMPLVAIGCGKYGDQDDKLPGKIVLYDPIAGKVVRVITGAFDEIDSVAFSVDGKLLATGGGGYDVPGELRLWDVANGQQVKKVSGVAPQVKWLGFSPDGLHLLSRSSGNSGELTLWDVEAAKPKWSINGRDREPIYSAALNNNGSEIAVGGGNGKTVLLDAESGRRLRLFTSRVPKTQALATQSHGSLVAVGCESTIHLWDTNSGTKVRSLRGHDGEIASLQFSADGRLLASAGSGQAIVWEASSGRPVRMFEQPGRKGLSFIDDNTFATASGSGITCYDVNSGALLNWISVTPRNLMSSFSVDGRWFVVGAGEKDLPQRCEIWDTREKRPSWSVHLSGSEVDSMQVSSDGKQVLLVEALGSPPHEKQTRRLVLCGTDGIKHPITETAIGGTIVSPQLSMDGRWVVAGIADAAQVSEMHLWDTSTRQQVAAWRRTTSKLAQLSLSGDGKRLLAIYGDKDTAELIVWKLEDRSQIMRVTLAGDPALRCAMSFDGSRCASALGDKRILTIWDVTSGRKLRNLAGHQGMIQYLTFNAAGDSLLSADTGGTTILWDVNTGARKHVLRGPGDELVAVDISDDGARLLTGSKKYSSGSEPGTGIVRSWDIASASMLQQFDGTTDRLVAVKFSPDGEQVFAGVEPPYSSDKDKVVRTTAFVWDSKSGRLVRSWQSQAAWDIDPEGSRFVTGEGSTFELETGRKITSAKRHPRGIQTAALSSDGQLAVTGGWGGSTVLWDANTGVALREFAGGDDYYAGVAVSNVSRRVVGTSNRTDIKGDHYPGTTLLWDLDTGRQIARLGGQKRYCSCVAFSPDEQTVAVGSNDGTVTFWSAADGRQLSTLPAQTYAIRALAYSPDGRRIVTGHANGAVNVWNLSTRAIVRSLGGHKGMVHTVSYSPDSKWIFTGGDYDSAFLWDAEALRGVKTLNKIGIVYGSAFTSDSRTLIVSTMAGLQHSFTVPDGSKLGQYHRPGMTDLRSSRNGKRMIGGGIIWQDDPFEQIAALDMPESVKCTRYSPDGRRIALAESSGRLMVIDAARGSRLATCDRHATQANQVGFLGSSQLVSTSDDGTAQIWDAATGAALISLLSFRGSDEWLAITPEGLYDGSEAARNEVQLRTAENLNLVPIDRFFQDYYYPGLLAAIAKGERPLPAGNFANKLAPLVKIVSPPHQQLETPTGRLAVIIKDQGGGIKTPWLMQNGARVLADHTDEKQGDVLKTVFTLPLVEGENRIEVRSASSDGSWESEPAVAILRCSTPQAKSAIYLVSVGINDYSDETMRLRFAATDADAMAALFANRAPALYGKQQVHVIRVLNEEATADGIRAALKKAAAATNPQDTLIIFLAGHGATVGQRYYFISHEFKQQAGRLEEDIRNHGLAIDAIGDCLTESRALKRVLIFDTCQSGSALAVAHTARDPFTFRGSLERVSRTQGVFTIAASSATAQAQEVPELKHGMLTYTLLAALGAVSNGPLVGKPLKITNESGLAEVREWFGYAQDKVPALSKIYFGEEQFISFSGEGASFAVLPLDQ